MECTHVIGPVVQTAGVSHVQVEQFHTAWQAPLEST